MYTGLLHTHSLLRYFILIALLVVIIKAVIGLMNKQPYGKWDNKFSLYLFIFTHMQLLVGLIIYFMSPFVKFGFGQTMSDKGDSLLDGRAYFCYAYCRRAYNIGKDHVKTNG